MFVLLLNDMRWPNVERVQPVARATTREALPQWLATEAVPPYWDGRWYKVYRPGGPLEWYNPPSDLDTAILAVPSLAELLAAAERVAAAQWAATEAVPLVGE